MRLILTPSEFVSEYIVGEPERKFKLLFCSYEQFDDILDVFKADVTCKILGEIEYQRSRERNQLDIRVQQSMGFSDVVFSEVNMHENISKLMDAETYESRFDYCLYNNSELINDVKSYIRTRRELDAFRNHISKLRGEDKIIMKYYLSEDMDYAMIGEAMNMSYSTVKMKIYRLKLKLKPGIIRVLSTPSC